VTVVDLTALTGMIAVTLLFLVPPGPDMAYMLTVGLHGGRRAAVSAILGIGTGMGVYAAAAVAGIGRVAASHPLLFDAVKVLGAAYLLWMAYVTARSAHRDTSGPTGIEPDRWYLRGFLVSLTNPKIMLFYLAVLPQFIGDAQNVTLQLAMLGTANIVAEVVLYGGLGVFAGAFHSRFTGSRKSQAPLYYVACSVYVALAVAIMTEVLMG
jgi:threonine/homoserine/homoserine lactone efflux protein